MGTIITAFVSFWAGFFAFSIFKINDTPENRRRDDEEQIKYLEEYNKKKREKKDKNEW